MSAKCCCQTVCVVHASVNHEAAAFFLVSEHFFIPHMNGVNLDMNEAILPKGSLVSVTSYGPVYGRKGTIRASDVIGGESSSPIIFYLVTLQDEPGNTLWFEQDAIEVCTGEQHV